MRRLILAMVVTQLSGSIYAVNPINFHHGTLADGTVAFELDIPPAAWSHISGGVRLDSLHPQPTEGMLEQVSEIIDVGMRRTHLCPGRWLMSEVIHLDDNGMVFTGTCGTAI
jgi:hypothetical protein